MDFIRSILIGFVVLFDHIFIWITETLYKLLLDLADVNIFGDEVIKMFGNRIYALLAIFMLFKISFSLINYLINPDDFSAKDKGFGSIVKNTMIAIILIVVTPMLFRYAFQFQGLILENQTINRLILGVGGDMSDSDQGKVLTFSIYSAFFKPNDKIPSIGDACANVYIELETGYSNNGASTGCAAALIDTLSSDGSDATSEDNVAKTFDEAVREQNATKLLSSTLYSPRIGDEPLFDFKFLVGTFVTGFVAIILLNFAFDIALRSVKLGFLQLIAPIPIVSYIDPKSKDKIFKKWYQEVVKTYLDLFIRLIAIFFAIFIISLVAKRNVTSFESGLPIEMNPFVFIFIIIGALTFAKQIPKLVEDLLGLKLSGSFSLNPMKKVAGTPLIGKGVGALTGGVDSLLGGKSFWSGMKTGSKAVPLMGGDGKKAFGMPNLKKRFETANTISDEKREYEKAKAVYEKGIMGNPNSSKREIADRIFKNDEFKQAYIDLAARKSERDKISGEFSRTKFMVESGQRKITIGETNYDLDSSDSENGAAAFAKALQELEVKKTIASSAFDKAKATLSDVGKIHADDLDAYKKFSRIDDMVSGQKSSFGENNNPPTPPAQTQPNQTPPPQTPPATNGNSSRTNGNRTPFE